MFNRVKGFFTRKKTENRPKGDEPTFFQRVKAKAKGVNKYVISAPDQYPSKEYPLFDTPTFRNDRREVEVDTNELTFLESISTKPTVTKTIDKRTMSPATANTPETEKEDMTLPIESLKDGQRRMYLFFYNKMKKHQGEQPSNNSIYASYDEINELFHTLKTHRDLKFPVPEKKLTKDEEKEYYHNVSDILSRDIFGIEMNILDLEIQKAESLNHVYPSADDPSILQFANQYGGYFNRYLPTMLESVRKFDYIADKEMNLCRAQIGVSPRPILESLDSPYCICCFMDSFHFERFLQPEIPGCSHYILLNKEHFPEARSYSKDKIGAANLPVIITGSKFLETSFIQDAFKEQGVDWMDEDLFTLVKREAPELLESSKVTLTTPSNLDTMTVFDHFMIFTSRALPEKSLHTYRDPLKLAVVRRTFDQNREFLCCDPFTAYCIKKKNSELWNKAFGVKTSMSRRGKLLDSNFAIYATLSDSEKLLIDFCQYQIVFKKYLELKKTQKNKSIEENLREASELYKDLIRSRNFLQYLYTLAIEQTVLNDFEKIQNNLITYDKPIETIEDVMNLIQKINPFWKFTSESRVEPSTRPVTRAPATTYVVEEKKPIQELIRSLNQGKQKYENLKQIGEKKLKDRLNYFAKLKSVERNTRRLGNILRMEQKTRKNYEFLRNYPIIEAKAKSELAKHRSKIRQSTSLPPTF